MPNVILIVADDLGMNDLNHGAGVGTPNIDSLRRNGVDFVNAYSGHATWYGGCEINIYLSSVLDKFYSISAPSRAALYTGRFATRFGFEFTPTPKIFGRYLTQPQVNNVRQPVYHTDRESSIPMMKDMVSSSFTFPFGYVSYVLMILDRSR